MSWPSAASEGESVLGSPVQRAVEELRSTTDAVLVLDGDLSQASTNDLEKDVVKNAYRGSNG